MTRRDQLRQLLSGLLLGALLGALVAVATDPARNPPLPASVGQVAARHLNQGALDLPTAPAASSASAALDPTGAA